MRRHRTRKNARREVGTRSPDLVLWARETLLLERERKSNRGKTCASLCKRFKVIREGISTAVEDCVMKNSWTAPTVGNDDWSWTRDTLCTVNQDSNRCCTVIHNFFWFGKQAILNPIAGILQMAENIFSRVVIDVDMLHHQFVLEFPGAALGFILRVEFRKVFWKSYRQDVSYIERLQQGYWAGSETTGHSVSVNFEKYHQNLIFNSISLTYKVTYSDMNNLGTALTWDMLVSLRDCILTADVVEDVAENVEIRVELSLKECYLRDKKKSAQL